MKRLIPILTLLLAIAQPGYADAQARRPDVRARAPFGDALTEALTALRADMHDDDARAEGQDAVAPARAAVPYDGGRGLITLEGISGMFLNPTSGTLPAGALTAQYCVAILEKNERTEDQHTAMISYGVTDWLEVGVLGRVTDPATRRDIGGGGPLARLRLVRDDGWMPEIAIGGMVREGNRNIEKYTAFAAASKKIPFAGEGFSGEDGFLRSLRLHLGFRQIWQNDDVNERDGSILYGGLELELPWRFYLVGEASTDDDVFNHHPFSFGVQWRPNSVLGLSVAGVQTGGEDRVSLFAGVGLVLQF